MSDDTEITELLRRLVADEPPLRPLRGPAPERDDRRGGAGWHRAWRWLRSAVTGARFPGPG